MVFKNKKSTNISKTTDFIFSALTFVFEKKGVQRVHYCFYEEKYSITRVLIKQL